MKKIVVPISIFLFFSCSEIAKEQYYNSIKASSQKESIAQQEDSFSQEEVGIPENLKGLFTRIVSCIQEYYGDSLELNPYLSEIVSMKIQLIKACLLIEDYKEVVKQILIIIEEVNRQIHLIEEEIKSRRVNKILNIAQDDKETEKLRERKSELISKKEGLNRCLDEVKLIDNSFLGQKDSSEEKKKAKIPKDLEGLFNKMVNCIQIIYRPINPKELNELTLMVDDLRGWFAEKNYVGIINQIFKAIRKADVQRYLVEKRIEEIQSDELNIEKLELWERKHEIDSKEKSLNECLGEINSMSK